MILSKNTKAIVRSSDGNTDFFYIVVGALQADILASYLLFSAKTTYFERK